MFTLIILQHFSQALLVLEHSIHPLTPQQRGKQWGQVGGEPVCWSHCTFAFEWSLMNLKAPEGAGLT